MGPHSGLQQNQALQRQQHLHTSGAAAAAASTHIRRSSGSSIYTRDSLPAGGWDGAGQGRAPLSPHCLPPLPPSTPVDTPHPPPSACRSTHLSFSATLAWAPPPPLSCSPPPSCLPLTCLPTFNPTKRTCSVPTLLPPPPSCPPPPSHLHRSQPKHADALHSQDCGRHLPGRPGEQHPAPHQQLGPGAHPRRAQLPHALGLLTREPGDLGHSRGRAELPTVGRWEGGRAGGREGG